MKKADRPSRYGGTTGQRAEGSGWMNWHVGRRRLDFAETDAVWRGYKRRVSWRRVL